MTAILSIFVLLPMAILWTTGSFDASTVASVFLVSSIGTMSLVLLGQLIERMNAEG